jgi:hypothetical protein
MTVAQVTNLQTWQIIVYPAVTLLLTVLLLGGTLYPFLRQAHKEHKRKVARTEASQDAVLGRDPDPSIGDPGQIGLIVTVPALAKTIGQLPEGQTVVSQQRAIKQEQEKVSKELSEHRTAVAERLAEDQTVVQKILDQHAESDQKNFAVINEALSKLVPKE